MSGRTMFMLRRPVISLLLLGATTLAVLAWQHRVALRAFPGIISAYTAKEYCSCRYVMNNPEPYCRGYVKQYLPSTLTDDPVRKVVSADGLGRSSNASWLGPRQGCRLNR
jgi:hypothetical protein